MKRSLSVCAAIQCSSQQLGATPCRQNGNEAGVALLTTLLLLTLLGAATVPLAVLARLQTRIGSYEVKRQQAHALAWSALQVAAMELPAPQVFSYPVDEEGNPLDTWLMTSETLVPEEKGGFRIRIVDEASKLPLGRTTEAVLTKLPGISAEAAAGICDWIDTDNNVRESGAEVDEYAEVGRLPRNGIPPSVAELGLAAGVTPDMVWGEDKNGNGVLDKGEDKDGDGALGPGLADWATVAKLPAVAGNLININQATAAQLVAASNNRVSTAQAQALVNYRQSRGSFTSLAQLASVPGFNWSSVRYLIDRLQPIARPGEDTSRVNFNTASETVLAALPGMTSELAAEVLEQRSEEPFSSLGTLWDLSTFGSDNAALLDWVAFTGGPWRIYITAWPQAGKPVVNAEALVSREGSTARIVSWQVF